MSNQPISDQPTVYHEGLTTSTGQGVSEDDIEEFGGYIVVGVVAENAERYGYGADDTGLKVRRNDTHIADADDLADAVRHILADATHRVCLVESPREHGRFLEAMLRIPQPAAAA